MTLSEAVHNACINDMHRKDLSPQPKECAVCLDTRPDVMARGLADGEFRVEAICSPCFSGSTARSMTMSGVEAGSFAF